jgi:hypothetical protein
LSYGSLKKKVLCDEVMHRQKNWQTEWKQSKNDGSWPIPNLSVAMLAENIVIY